MIPHMATIDRRTSGAQTFLVLDDDPDRVRLFRHGLGDRMFHVARASDAVGAIVRYHWQAIFLDHDLLMTPGQYGLSDPGTGMEVVDYLIRHPRVQSKALIVVHSLNGNAGKTMVQALRESGRRVTRRTYAWEDQHDLLRLHNHNSWRTSAERWNTWRL